MRKISEIEDSKKITDYAVLAYAVMAALSSRFHSLSDEDVCILADLYTAALGAAMATAEAVEEPEGSLTLAE